MALSEGLGVDRGVDRRPGKPQSHVCVRCMPREASLQVKRLLRTSVLLIICRSRVRAPPAPPTVERSRRSEVCERTR
jgi:hypothetical protein